jgi:ubiquinone/menaquinone biosynthesis C-methylase UbiE
MSYDPKRIVRSGYDAMAERFGAWRGEIAGSSEAEWVADLLERLPSEPAILELCCGAASPTTMLLAERGDLLGIDFSSEQLRRARDRCPDARFVEADVTKVELEAQSFDAVVSVYAFNHVPRADLPRLLERIGRWLKPGGHLLASFGRSGGEGIQEDWLGVPMFFASYTEEENRELVLAAGLEIERDEVVPIVEPEYGEARFHWILAQRP